MGERGKNVDKMKKCTKQAYSFRSLAVLAYTVSSQNSGQDARSVASLDEILMRHNRNKLNISGDIHSVTQEIFPNDFWPRS